MKFKVTNTTCLKMNVETFGPFVANWSLIMHLRY